MVVIFGAEEDADSAATEDPEVSPVQEGSLTPIGVKASEARVALEEEDEVEVEAKTPTCGEAKMKVKGLKLLPTQMTSQLTSMTKE